MNIKKGDKFGRLVVKGKAIRKKSRQRFRCLCDCGNRTVVRKDSLVSGNTRSCGCLNEKNNFKHGMVGTKEYSS